MDIYENDKNNNNNIEIDNNDSDIDNNDVNDENLDNENLYNDDNYKYNNNIIDNDIDNNNDNISIDSYIDDISDTNDSIPSDLQNSLIKASINLTKVNHWLKKKEEISRAKQLLLKSDPFIGENRDIWLLICRVLKVISSGNDDLLETFIKWTNKAGESGFIRSRNARKAWTLQRPFTNCDHPVLCQTRIFLQNRYSSLKESESIMKFDNVAKSVINSAEQYLKERAIIFQRNDSTFNSNRIKNLGNDNDNDNNDNDNDRNNDRNNDTSPTVYIPAAIYQYDTNCIENITIGDIGNLYGTKTIIAYVSTGDVLYIRSKMLQNYYYYKVINIDLIHARIRVIKTLPPPQSWYPHPTNEDPQWILISQLWNTTVFRQELPTDSDEDNLKYIVFVTPLPSGSAALAILSALPKIEQIKVNINENNNVVHNNNNNNLKPRKSQSKSLLPANKSYNEKSIIPKFLLKKPKITQQILRIFTHAAILTWKVMSRKLILNTSNKKVKENYIEEELSDIDVTISISPINNNPRAKTIWKDVYKGKGRGCQINGLDELTSYHCRITCSDEKIGVEQGKVVSSYTIISTIANSPPEPRVRQVSGGIEPGTVRIVVQLNEISTSLPNGCCYQIECLVEGIKKTSWKLVCRGNQNSMLISGHWLGKSIFLRSRIMNQDNNPGIESPQVYLQIEGKYEKSVQDFAKKKNI